MLQIEFGCVILYIAGEGNDKIGRHIKTTEEYKE